MISQTSPVVSQSAPNPEPIFDLATGFMRAKHLFVTGELGIFEKLADGPVTLEELAARLGTPRRTTRIIVDAVIALGLRAGQETHDLNAIQDHVGHRSSSSTLLYLRADAAQKAQSTIAGMSFGPLYEKLQ